MKSTKEYALASQEQALRVKFFQATIEKDDVDPKCRVCGRGWRGVVLV